MAGILRYLFFAGATGWLTRNWWLNPGWGTALSEQNWSALIEPSMTLGIMIIAAAVFWWILSLELRNLCRSIETEEGIDVFFKRAYKDELSLKKRADLHATWQSIKPVILDIMRVHGLRSLSATSSSKKLLKNLEVAIDKEIPPLRSREKPAWENNSIDSMIEPSNPIDKDRLAPNLTTD